MIANYITFTLINNKKKIVKAINGFSLMEIAVSNNINGITGLCGGCLSCATCHVIFKKNDFKNIQKQFSIKENEEEILDLLLYASKNSRLSCQIIMNDSLNGLEIKIPKQ